MQGQLEGKHWGFYPPWLQKLIVIEELFVNIWKKNMNFVSELDKEHSQLMLGQQ